MSRSMSYTRYQRNRAINRKIGICRRIGGDALYRAWTVNGEKLGKLSKGKIHCSCGLCRCKSYDYISTSDRRKLDKTDIDLQEG